MHQLYQNIELIAGKNFYDKVLGKRVGKSALSNFCHDLTRIKLIGFD